MIQGLMMHEQLTISQLLDHAARNHGERQIACFAGAQTVRYDYATLRDRVSLLAECAPARCFQRRSRCELGMELPQASRTLFRGSGRSALC